MATGATIQPLKNLFPACFALALLAGLSLQGLLTAQLTVFVLLRHGLIAVAILLAAYGLGLLPSRVLSLHTLPIRWRLMLAQTLGLGLLPLVVLGLGSMGWLHRSLGWTIVGVLGFAGLVSLLRQLPVSEAPIPLIKSSSGRWLWLLAAPFLTLILLVAVTPPGWLWAEEGFGYDELEYHLQVPKEYMQNGRITYLPHNVYANFPSNVEMLYLLCMVLDGDPVSGAMSGKLLNAALALLTVAAAWLIGREDSPQAGRGSALLCAGTGWIAYLSGVAYVENGMLLFGMMAMAAIRKGALHRRDDRMDERLDFRCMGLAGVFVGFACGCKYTAIPLMALPFALSLLVGTVKKLRRNVIGCAVLTMCTVATFSPWLAKNMINTGNPMFPLFNSLFDGRPPEWGLEETAHFDRGHLPSPQERTWSGRAAAWWKHVAVDAPYRRWGPLVWAMAAWAMFIHRRDRWTWICIVILVGQTLLWAATTHLYARIAVPMLIPLLALAGRSGAVPEKSYSRVVFPYALLIAGLSLNLFNTGRLYAEHVYRTGQKLPVEGGVELFLGGAPIAAGHQHVPVINALPANAKVLAIGDAKAFYLMKRLDYRVVFNRQPFAERVRTATATSQIMDGLMERGYTHIYVNWMEIQRLRGSAYGFPEEIKPELFERLMQFRLKRTNVFTIITNDREIPYGELYQMPLGTLD